MSESYIEVDGRIVGNSQIEQPDNSSTDVLVNGRGGTATASKTKIHEYVTIVPQGNPRSSFVLDVTDVPAFEPKTNVKIRIFTED